ncbi:uncharacterized protein LOC116348654 [Contarinia nasturtii]|uniref:uncharacterized protein LOC116348654 n=1 Tax=Contarinia nasturtii TaxID=265458 RepID=UPI0012D40FD7|nr:uncharacterized protein LOC116348654 [Contarinia nasturtii]
MNDDEIVAKRPKLDEQNDDIGNNVAENVANEVILLDDDDDANANELQNGIVDQEQNGNGIDTFSTLNEDCCRSIFDWLSSGDVKSVGQTCKKMNKLIDFHIKHKYPAKKLLIRTPLTYFLPASERTPNGFHKCYRNVILEDFDIGIFRFLATHIETIDKIQFGQKIFRKRLDNEMVDCIKEQLKVATSIEFLGCKIDGDLYNMVLQFCEDMKRLSIRIYSNEGIYMGINDDWLKQTYPKLEHLALVKDARPIPQLKNFFQKNQTVKSFTTSMSIINLNKSIFQQGAVKLNDLGIELNLDDKENVQMFSDFLNKIEKSGRFNRLKLRFMDPTILTDHADDIAAMNGLHSIYFDCEVKINKEFIEALTKLTFQMLYIRRPIADCDDEEPLINGALNVKELYFQEIESKGVNTHIVPFIEKAPNLRKIVIRKVNGRLDMELTRVNKERDMMKRLEIFVDETTFLHIKWHNKDTKFDSIEVKRFDADLTNHPFALHDE